MTELTYSDKKINKRDLTCVQNRAFNILIDSIIYKTLVSEKLKSVCFCCICEWYIGLKMSSIFL